VRFFFLVAVAALLVGCHHRKPRFSDAQMKQIRAESPGMKEECLEILRWGGVEALTRPAEECYKFDPPRRWKGRWFSGFETSIFCPDSARHCPPDNHRDMIWLEVGPTAQIPVSARDNRYAAGMFEVDLIGRKSSFPGEYGNMGGTSQEIIMDQLLSMKRVPMYSDAELARMHARGMKTSCFETIRWGGLGSFRDPEECYEKLPARRWRGLWRNDPNIAFFCPDPARECPQGPESQRISLEYTALPQVSGWGGLYRLDFIGRRTARGGSWAGHGAAQDIIVDRLISVKEIEPPPKG
jgi:hypothetical protein